MNKEIFCEGFYKDIKKYKLDLLEVSYFLQRKRKYIYLLMENKGIYGSNSSIFYLMNKLIAKGNKYDIEWILFTYLLTDRYKEGVKDFPFSKDTLEKKEQEIKLDFFLKDIKTFEEWKKEIKELDKRISPFHCEKDWFKEFYKDGNIKLADYFYFEKVDDKYIDIYGNCRNDLKGGLYVDSKVNNQWDFYSMVERSYDLDYRFTIYSEETLIKYLNLFSLNIF
jgi:hypothetical protein